MFQVNQLHLSIQQCNQLAEIPLRITIKTKVTAPIEKIREHRTNSSQIMKRDNTSDDRHTSKTVKDLTVGRKFPSRMEAKDASFDFEGTIRPSGRRKKTYKITEGWNSAIVFIRQVHAKDCGDH